MNKSQRITEMQEIISEILPHLGDEWKLRPLPDDDCFNDRWRHLDGDQGRCIVVESPWNDSGILEYRACGWPYYTTSDGRQRMVTPNVHLRGAPVPVTRANKRRDPAKVANQIMRRVIEPYNAIWIELINIRDANNERESEDRRAVQAIAKACEYPGDIENVTRATFYYEDTRIKVQSSGMVTIDTDAETTLKFLEWLKA